MSKPYGLITKQAPVSRPKIFDSDSDEAPVEKPTSLKRLKPQDRQTQIRAVEEDPTVYQYDEIYDEMDKKRKDLVQAKNKDRTPKYIGNLLKAADRRKKENERRIERQIKKEREDEGDEFKDKEAFVTPAYRKKLEEMKEMEAQEQREEYLEEIGSVKKQGNLDGFYRHLYDQKVNYEDRLSETIKEEPSEEPKAQDEEAPQKKKRRYRKHEESDGEEEISENKEHIQSNLDADSDFSIDSSDEEKVDKPTPQPAPKIAVEVVKTEQIEPEQPIPETPEEPKVKINIWKKRTVDDNFTTAVLRYHERKSSRQGLF